MAQPLTKSLRSSAGFDHHVVLCPTRPAAHVLGDFQEQAGPPAARAAVRVKSRLMCHIVVVEVAGRLGEVVEDLDKAIELALAEGHRGVICDLSAVLEDAEPEAVEVLASAGRHLHDWPGIPVAVACSNPAVSEALRAHPLGRHLIVTASMFSALSAVLATPTPAVEWQRLAPHPTAPRASREFVARTLLDWGLAPLIPAVSLVVSELVTNSAIHAGTDIDLSVAWSLGALRVTVRDNSPDLPHKRYARLDVNGRGLSLVGALSRAFGVLPTADGGKVVWVVLNAARPRPRIQRPSSRA